MLDVFLYISYVLLIVGTLITVFWPVVHAAQDPKSAGKSAIGVVVLVVIFGISYALSGDEVTAQYQALGVNSAVGSKMIGAGMIMFYIVFIVGAAALIFGEIAKAFK